MNRQVEILLAVLLLLCLAACTPKQVATSPESTVVSEWKGLPVISGAAEIQESPNSYRYTVDQSLSKVKKFYQQQMPLAGWELLGDGDTSTDQVDEAYTLWFSKGDATATVEVFVANGVTHVGLKL